MELGLVGPFLAEEMELPCATLISNIEPDPEDGGMRLRRPVEGGYEILQASVPFLGTITNDESNVPRYASVRGIRAAMGAEIPVWSSDELDLDPAQVGSENARIEMDELFVPQREMRCEFIEGESGAEKGRNLIVRLRELKLI